jgi:hypothetical protein
MIGHAASIAGSNAQRLIALSVNHAVDRIELLPTWTDGLTSNEDYVRLNVMGVARLQDALQRLTAAIRDVEAEVAAMEVEHDPLASHIFISRRHYRNASDTKGGKRREVNARLSFNTACELGFRGSLDEWERLMGAVARR